MASKKASYVFFCWCSWEFPVSCVLEILKDIKLSFYSLVISWNMLFLFIIEMFQSSEFALESDCSGASLYIIHFKCTQQLLFFAKYVKLCDWKNVFADVLLPDFIMRDRETSTDSCDYFLTQSLAFACKMLYSFLFFYHLTASTIVHIMTILVCWHICQLNSDHSY